MARSPTHVALLAVGDPESPHTWSGTTAGVLGGLREMGVVTQAVDLTLPGVGELALLTAGAVATRNRFDAQSSSLTALVRGALARRKLRERPPHGVIQIGATVALPPGVRYVTLEDMTLRQACAVHPVFSRMSSRAITSSERRREDLYRDARMCGAASHWAGDSLIADYGVARERVAVVGLGANHRIAQGTEPRDWRSPRFLFVGIDWQRKGGPLVLRAFSRLRDLHTDATLDVVGGHPPLDQPGVHGHGVRSPDDANDRELMAGLFARATCLVMPSAVEPFGIVHIEAASAGIPSIATSVGGPRDVIGPDGGVIVVPGDERGLFEAMCRVSEPDTARRMGEAAQQRARLYTWSCVAERLLRALGLEAPDGRPLADFL